LIIQEKSSEFAWVELLHVPITLTLKALGTGVDPEYALGWVVTFEIFCRSGTVVIGFILGLSKIVPSALGLIV